MRIAFAFLLLTVHIPCHSGVLPATCAVRPALMERIARQEGFYRVGTLPARLHNPGALVYAGQHGAAAGERGYARFWSDEAGWRALEADLWRKLRARRPLMTGWEYLGAI